jgi:hypothetical protein
MFDGRRELDTLRAPLKDKRKLAELSCAQASGAGEDDCSLPHLGLGGRRAVGLEQFCKFICHACRACRTRERTGFLARQQDNAPFMWDYPFSLRHQNTDTRAFPVLSQR